MSKDFLLLYDVDLQLLVNICNANLSQEKIFKSSVYRSTQLSTFRQIPREICHIQQKGETGNFRFRILRKSNPNPNPNPKQYLSMNTQNI